MAVARPATPHAKRLTQGRSVLSALLRWHWCLYPTLEAAGLGHLREQDEPTVFHDLRHTFGTLCAAEGIDLPRIQRWMGHADIQTTMRYLHYVPAHDDAARLTAAFTGEVGTQTGTERRTRVRNSAQLSDTESAR